MKNKIEPQESISFGRGAFLLLTFKKAIIDLDLQHAFKHEIAAQPLHEQEVIKSACSNFEDPSWFRLRSKDKEKRSSMSLFLSAVMLPKELPRYVRKELFVLDQALHYAIHNKYYLSNKDRDDVLDLWIDFHPQLKHVAVQKHGVVRRPNIVTTFKDKLVGEDRFYHAARAYEESYVGINPKAAEEYRSLALQPTSSTLALKF